MQRLDTEDQKYAVAIWGQVTMAMTLNLLESQGVFRIAAAPGHGASAMWK